MFLANLANARDPGHFDPPLEDDEWCRANRPAELVGHLSVKREWKGPSRILRLMEGGGSSEAEERNSQSASFDLFDIADLAHRSEEHTSELQSLMRISYAVFCLKKKKTHTINKPSTPYI